MGQELLDKTGYQRKPRTYYHAVATNGAQALRVVVKIDTHTQL